MRYASDLLRYSHLIWSFAARDIQARYRQTVLGLGWAVLQPLSLMLVFTMVFGKFARVPSDGVPYPLFTYSALIFWSFFATTISQGTVALTANANLVRKIYFPRETLLLSVLVSASLDLLIAFSILIGLFVYYRVVLTWAVLWVLPLFLLQVLFVLAVICISSLVHARFRDIGHVLPLGLQLWMFASPVAYPLSVVPDQLRGIYMLNPMVGIIDGYRRALLHGQGSSVSYLSILLGVTLVSVLLAYLAFKWAERTFADVV